MVQILNKMVHLKYPFQKYADVINMLPKFPPSRLKFDTMLRKVFPNNLAAQLCTSHSRRENMAPNFVCLFQPIKCKHLKLRFLATFGTCHSSQMPSPRLKCSKKLRNMSPSRFVSTALHKSLHVTGKIRRVLHVNFECFFWPIKCMHPKPILGTLWILFASQMPFLRL